MEVHKVKVAKAEGHFYLTFTYGEDEFREASDASLGLCLGCGVEAEGCEPDARKYTCEACGEARVYGLEELLVMGRITIVGP